MIIIYHYKRMEWKTYTGAVLSSLTLAWRTGAIDGVDILFCNGMRHNFWGARLRLAFKRSMSRCVSCIVVMCIYNKSGIRIDDGKQKILTMTMFAFRRENQTLLLFIYLFMELRWLWHIYFSQIDCYEYLMECSIIIVIMMIIIIYMNSEEYIFLLVSYMWLLLSLLIDFVLFFWIDDEDRAHERLLKSETIAYRRYADVIISEESRYGSFRDERWNFNLISFQYLCLSTPKMYLCWRREISIIYIYNITFAPDLENY